jgi:thiosulfate reductase cytochrome b subunit
MADHAARPSAPLRHPRWVRCTHWLAAASIFVLAFTGIVILMAHPRLYWGEVGNDLTPALIELPISRNHRHGGWEARAAFFDESGSPVSASRTFDIFNKNGWGRSLHFLAAWALVLTGIVYLMAGLGSGHLWRHLVPRRAELSPPLVRQELANHLRLRIRAPTGGPHYGLLQKCAYCVVVFVALPLLSVSGLAMSPAVTAAWPFLLDVFGGFQSARTIHFVTFVAIATFVAGHVLMVVLSGFVRQMRAMTLGG